MKLQKGFTLVEGLLLLVIAGIIGFTGWYVWNSKNKTESTYDSVNSSSIPKYTAIKTFDDCKKSAGSKIQESYPEVCVTATGKKFTGPAGTKYLEIKEWGVKIPLSANISDAYYIYKNGIVYLSLDSLKNTDSCSADKVSIGAYSSYKSTSIDENTGKPYQSEMSNGASVGDYYYDYTQAQAFCSEDQAVKDKAKTAAEAFKNAISGVIAI